MKTSRILITAVSIGVLVAATQSALAQPARLPRQMVDASLWKAPTAVTLPRSAGIELVFAGGSAPEPFRVDHALLKVLPGKNLQETLKKIDHQSLYPTQDGQPMIVGGPAAPRRGPLIRRQNLPPNPFVAVRLRPGLVPSLEAAMLVRKRFGISVRFSSEQALQAMGEILKYDLMPDFVMSPTQLISGASDNEAAALHEANRAPHDDPYWAILDLWRAWQFGQIAAPTAARDVWVAVVDQGFLKPPVGVVWDAFRANDGSIGEPGDFAYARWHGTNCGSVLNASVNDGIGAAGSALLGPLSNVAMITQRRIRTMAVEIPAGYGGSFAWIGEGIRQAVQSGVDIVNVSYGADCGPACSSTYGGTRPDEPIVNALKVAQDKSVLVLFSAGNDSLDLDDPNHDIIGCETQGALCVGGFNRNQYRWVTDDGKQGSNYGSAVKLWGPAHHVWVNPDSNPLPHSDPGGNPSTHVEFGTSFAAPFMAGVLALVESSAGQRLARDTVLQKLGAPRILTPGMNDLTGKATATPSFMNAYEFMRLFARPARDAFESRPSAFPTPLDLLTLDDPKDVDIFAIESNGCERLDLTIYPLRDDRLGKLKVVLRVTGAQPRVVDAVETGETLGVSAIAGAGKHTLEVSQEGTLTTGYSVTLTRQAFVGGQGCAPPDDIVLDPVHPRPEDDPPAAATDIVPVGTPTAGSIVPCVAKKGTRCTDGRPAPGE